MLQSQAKREAQGRRPAAHLPVGLRRERPGLDAGDRAQKAQSARHAGVKDAFASPEKSLVRRSSEEGNDSGASSADPAKKWFDESNERSGGTLGELMIADNDEPFFLRTYSSSPSNHAERLDLRLAASGHSALQYGQGPKQTATNNSSVDDFRSVIDDLTIENKRLKERLRKYETVHTAYLKKDRLFEVRIHGLPARKKRELEETLHAFASSIGTDGSSTTFNSQLHLGTTDKPNRPLQTPSTDPSSVSTSNSRPFDSAYASMSTSGPASRSASNYMGLDRKRSAPPAKPKSESLLLDTPLGLLPRHPTVMTERMKKKLVVQRLEQLFTGKNPVPSGEYSQPQQTQGVSISTTPKEHRVGQGQELHASEEGVREALILTPNMYLDKKKAPRLQTRSNAESSPIGQAEATKESASTPDSPEQRPTRPLDLDPDRAQIPSENIEYIRHLGLSTPNMTPEGSEDAADADGWVYLNLLVNMAQLHIINVTADFVRSAVAKVSEKFQLSSDGRKVRWRGGSEGTKFSSDSGVDSVLRGSPCDSDSLDESHRKRRKTNTSPRENIASEQTLKHGQLPSAPHSPANRNKHSHDVKRHPAFHYKPMFRHPHLSRDGRMSLDESSTQVSDVRVDESGTGHITNPRRGTGRRPQSEASSRRRRDDGAIVFYSGAPFCTDLSGDRESIDTPLHAADVGMDGYSNHTYDAVGCVPRKTPLAVLSRTPSESKFPFRPFKKSSLCAPLLGTGDRAQSPEPLTSETTSDLDFSPQWTADGSSKDPSLQKFDASGLGGTRPADHFEVKVETRHTKLDGGLGVGFSRFSPSRLRSRNQLWFVSKSTRDLFRTSESPDFADSLASRLATMRAHSPSPQLAPPPVSLPVRTQILSSHVRYLQPSELPPPATYHAPYSSSDDEYTDDATSDSTNDRINEPRQSRPLAYRMFSPVSIDGDPVDANESDSDDEGGDSSDGSDSSLIGSLAPVGAQDSDIVMGRSSNDYIPVGSSGTTVDEASAGLNHVSLPNMSIG